MTEGITVRVAHTFLAVAFVFALSACGARVHEASFKQDFTPLETAKVSVGEITDVAPKGERGEQENFDTAAELRKQLNAKLAESNLLASETTGEERYVLNAEIVDYDPGSAGKRWLWPGYGSTELSVKCAIYKGDEKVGNVFARRTVEAGGLYTVGAWKGVFDTVAEDIVEELKKKLGV